MIKGGVIMSEYFQNLHINNDFPFQAFICNGNDSIHPHWHKEIEIIYVISGSVNLGVDDEIIQLQEEEVYIIDSGVSHYFLPSGESERIVFQFDTKIFEENQLPLEKDHLIYEIFQVIENHSINWSKDAKKSIINCLTDLYEEVENKESFYLYAIQGYLNQLLVLLARVVSRKINPQKTMTQATLKNKEALEKLNKVFLYIEKNYYQAIIINEVAEYIGFSPNYFSKFFKKHTNVAFNKFLTEYRINKAKYILANESLPMLDVADQVGFNSVKTFHHMFKEIVSISPYKFQKIMNGNK